MFFTYTIAIKRELVINMSTNYTHLIFIINEHSRKGKHTRKLLTRHMKEHAMSFELHTTEYKRHAVELACELAQSEPQESLIIAVGGDGTLNEVVSGLYLSKIDRPVSYIPTGSGNDFARSHDLSKSIQMSLERIINKNSPVELDILDCHTDEENLVAVNSIGFGIDGMVISKLDQTSSKKTIGKSSYLLSVLSAFFSQKSFSLSLDSKDLTINHPSVLLVVCANHKFFGGGIPIHPLADATDSFIDVVVAEQINFLELLQILYMLITKESHLSHKKMHSYRVSSCKLTLDSQQYGQRDGELIDRNTHTLSISTVKQLFWL